MIMLAEAQDDDDRDYYDACDDDDPEVDFDCGMDRHGNCGKAGSEECDWDVLIGT